MESGMCAPLPVEGREHKKMSHVLPVLPKTIKWRQITMCVPPRDRAVDRRRPFPAGEPHTRDTSSTWRLTAGVTPKATCWEGAAVAKL